MKRRAVLFSLVSAIAILKGSPISAQSSDLGGFVGSWSGILSIGSNTLRLRLEIGADSAVSLFSLDQGGAAIPGRLANITGGEISLQFAAIGAGFVGTKTGNKIVGMFRQGRNDLPLTFLRGADAGFQNQRAAVAPLTQDMLNELRSRAQSPALIAAAQSRTSPSISMVSGFRSARADTPATVNDKWHLGSITKSMTAVVTARLIERGLLNWDTKIVDVLGQIAPNMRAEYRDATVLHLLSHQSGLPGNLPIPRLLGFHMSAKAVTDDRIDYTKLALALPPIGPMGSKFEYSNNGYVVLGTMLEVLTEKSWEELIVAELFTPLGMASAGFGAPGTRSRLDQPLGHSKSIAGNRRKPANLGGRDLTDNPAVLGPAGRVHASAADALTYATAHRDYNPILRIASWEQLHKVHFGGEYACGLVKRANGDLWHNGSNTLWYAEITFNSQTGICAFACANDGYLPSAGPELGSALLGIMAAASGS